MGLSRLGDDVAVLADEASWNDATVIGLLVAFIDDEVPNGAGELRDYLRAQIEEERKMGDEDVDAPVDAADELPGDDE